MRETLVDFLRHGEPVGGRRYRGDGVDDPLSEKGWQQMWAAVGDPVPWQRVVSSPLQRCHAFALALAERHRLPLRVEQRFREVGQGAWEGLTPDQIRQRDPDAGHALTVREHDAVDAGRAVVAVLHDLNLAAAYADRVMLLNAGTIAAIGEPSEVLTADVLTEVYERPIAVIDHPYRPCPLVLTVD